MYRGAANPAAVERFGEWLGREPSWALDFLPSTSWRALSHPRWFAERWAPSSYRVVYSVPLLADDGDSSLADGASGAYDDYFRRLARELVAAGEGDAVIRLGWEFNGDWFPWAAAGDEESFVAYWRRVVTVMRSVDGGRLTFDWSPAAGPNSMPADAAYPGDGYVDYIGLDVYDVTSDPDATPQERWDELTNEPYGLAWHAGFAAAHAKPMTFPEWGLWLGPNGDGGADDPYFVDQMRRWTALNDVAYQMYFDYDGADGVVHELTSPDFSQAGAAYRRDFGMPPATAPLAR